MKRFYPFAFSVLSLFFFCMIARANIFGARTEIMILAMALGTAIAIAVFLGQIWAYTDKQNFIVGCILIALAVAKHFLLPYRARIPSFHYFAIVPFIFCIGEAFLLLSVWDLYQKNSTKFRVIFYNGMVLVSATYFSQTVFWVYFFIFFMILCVLYARSQFPSYPIVAKQAFAIARKILVLLAILLVCFIPAFFIAKNRDSLRFFHPLRFFTFQNMGFSSLSTLVSQKLKASQEAIFYYYADPGVHYLRGKAFDHYEKRQWSLSQNNTTFLPEKKTASSYQYFLDADKCQSNGSIQKLVFLQQSKSLFIPISTDMVSFITRVELKKDQESILESENLLPMVAMVHIQKTPFASFPKEDFGRYLQIPEENKSYFLKKAKEIIAQTTEPLQQARKLANYLKNHYPYSLETNIEDHLDPLVYFLEKKPPVHCEIFASAFIMMARSLGIPARYLKGYCVHEWNEEKKCLIVRNCDAHAWAEVYIAEKGWITIEATPVSTWQAEIKKRQNILFLLWNSFLEWWETWENVSWNDILQKIAMLLAFPLVLWLFFYAKKRFSLIRKKNRQKRFLLRNPHLQNLLKEFLTSQTTDKPIRGKYPHETIREYLLAVCASFPQEAQNFSLKLTELIEKDLYAEEKMNEVRTQQG